MRLDIITFKWVYIYDMRDQVALSMAIALAWPIVTESANKCGKCMNIWLLKNIVAKTWPS